jgi:hypothetical protein
MNHPMAIMNYKIPENVSTISFPHILTNMSFPFFGTFYVHLDNDLVIVLRFCNEYVKNEEAQDR